MIQARNGGSAVASFLNKIRSGRLLSLPRSGEIHLSVKDRAGSGETAGTILDIPKYLSPALRGPLRRFCLPVGTRGHSRRGILVLFWNFSGRGAPPNIAEAGSQSRFVAAMYAERQFS